MPSSTLWIQAFSGLGLFLFGMLFLESQMKQAAGRSFKRIVRGATGTPFKSLMTGLGATALFQSSSVVTLMALSLIGAQLMTLGAAVAVIFGANLGTTVTAWIIALVGFKLDIKLLSYVMIGIGGLGGAFAPTQGRWKYGFGILTGFGLLFLGLEGMKESFESFSAVVDLRAFSGRHPYEFALVGLAVTALVQSSSASIAIAQSAVYTHMIGFEAAAAFVVGANVGTTVTAVLGSLGGSADKKRTALAHFVFNISTGATALLLLPPLVMLVQCAAGALNPVIQIALFHTLFNLMGVVLWFPFITPLEKMLLRFFRKKALTVTAYIHNVPVSVPDLALDALEKEVAALSKRIEEFALLVINIPPPKVLDAHQDIGELLNRNQHNFDIAYDRLYEKIRLHEGEIYRYIVLLSSQSERPDLHESLSIFQQRIAYLATAAKALKDMLYDLNRLYEAASGEEHRFYRDLRYQILETVLAYRAACSGNAAERELLEQSYKRMARSYKNSMGAIDAIAKNTAIPPEMTSITVNALHLTKSFSKSLRNAQGLPLSQ